MPNTAKQIVKLTKNIEVIQKSMPIPVVVRQTVKPVVKGCC